MIRIYIKFKKEYLDGIICAITEVSLTPFKGECYYVDLEDNKVYDISLMCGDYDCDLKVYNGTFEKYGWWDSKNNRFIEDEDELIDEDDPYTEGCWCQKYKEGKPVGEPYFDGEHC